MEPSLIISNKSLIVNPVDGAPSLRRATVDKVAAFGVILGSGLLLFSLAALSVTAVTVSSGILALSLLLKHVIKHIDDLVEDSEGIIGTQLSIAAFKGNALKAHILLALGANPNETHKGACSPALNTAIESAMDYRSVTIVRELLKHGAEVDRPDPVRDANFTPLYYALMPDNNGTADRIAMELLSFGADANSPTTPLQTHLYKAAILGKEHLVNALLTQGAAINAPGKDDGSTPLLGAIEHCHPHIVQILLERGADKTLGKDGLTPLELAQKMRAEMSGDDDRLPRVKRMIELLS